MKETYLDAIRLTERLHRQFLELVKAELDRLGMEDINNVQAFILYNIGREELTVGELTNRGYYLGSNVSYNVRKMVENGFIVQERSTHDRRSIRVKLTAKGLDLCNRMEAMFDKQLTALSGGMSQEEMANASNVYRRLERFLISMLDYGIRSQGMF
ncbi:MarR family winged helix-turn-helix transcriptional regulator [Lacibacterium aquatile]|uniref:MarR family winged helix-turn-helix transcriptional regulator n=1 Tax=Lacibacterium aquatile TaxID=1168082 RepID=A0ABW5DQ89_9PROT